VKALLALLLPSSGVPTAPQVRSAVVLQKLEKRKEFVCFMLLIFFFLVLGYPFLCVKQHRFVSNEVLEQ